MVSDRFRPKDRGDNSSTIHTGNRESPLEQYRAHAARMNAASEYNQARTTMTKIPIENLKGVIDSALRDRNLGRITQDRYDLVSDSCIKISLFRDISLYRNAQNHETLKEIYGKISEQEAIECTQLLQNSHYSEAILPRVRPSTENAEQIQDQLGQSPEEQSANTRPYSGSQETSSQIEASVSTAAPIRIESKYSRIVLEHLNNIRHYSKNYSTNHQTYSKEQRNQYKIIRDASDKLALLYNKTRNRQDKSAIQAKHKDANISHSEEYAKTIIDTLRDLNLREKTILGEVYEQIKEEIENL